MNKLFLLALLGLFVFTSAIRTEEGYNLLFKQWSAKYNKVFTSADEMLTRYNIFRTAVDFVDNWNQDEHGFAVALNEFADLTSEEFRALMNGYKSELRGQSRDFRVVEEPVPTLPDSVDWRQKGAVTHVKNQGNCGSCWSFSTTGSVEGALGVANPSQLIGLSEQNLVDCSHNGNMGCNGGLMDNAFKWIISNGFIDTEASYPYVGVQHSCTQTNPGRVKGAKMTGYKDVVPGESNLQEAVANVGPISVAIDASHMSFQLYSHGVYYEPACSSTRLDHGVLAVGYGTDSGQAYWLVKNSWGTSWGMQGYIEMARNRNNNCGIATEPSYPTGVTRA
jgi:cathepsin L